MKWLKKGVIFKPDTNLSWMRTHVQHPTPCMLSDSIVRMFFSGRDDNNHAQIGYVDVEVGDNLSVINYSKMPVLTCGNGSDYDANGIYPSCVIDLGDEQFMYTAGRKNNGDVLFDMGIGLAISKNKTDFKKHTNKPIVARGEHDVWMTSTPWVYIVGDEWRMIYISGLECNSINGNKKNKYHLKYATSSNGVDWLRRGYVAIDFMHEGETCISRPSILFEDGIYKMWYSYACLDVGIPYMAGYAESLDGMNWVRKDFEAGIDVTPDDFDSDMICYPLVMNIMNKKYMFYNGNKNGAEGMAYAISGDANG